jgi:glycosyltransferase involved in cell wall biosynthesis
LRAALLARGLLDSSAPTLAIKARDGGAWLRCADGVSAAWVQACGRSRLRWWRYVRRERRAIEAADRVIAISPMVHAELARWYGRMDAATVINPILTPPATRALPDEALRDGAQRRQGAVFVGHGFWRKGLDRAIAARPAGMPLTVVGADRGPPHPNVRYVGALDAAPFIAQAEVLLHPARYEPYGNVVAEAVAAGTPAVVSDATGAACLLDPRHVWTQSTGIDGLRGIIEAVLRDPRPPARQPPSGDAHVDALLAALR